MKVHRYGRDIEASLDDLIKWVLIDFYAGLNTYDQKRTPYSKRWDGLGNRARVYEAAQKELKNICLNSKQ